MKPDDRATRTLLVLMGTVAVVAAACTGARDRRFPADDGGGPIDGAARVDAGPIAPRDGSACVPESDVDFCARLSKDCDLVSGFDSCGVGRTANCGTCAPPTSCGGGGVANVCGGCEAETDAELCAVGGFDCGLLDVTDRCGTRRMPSCGTCPSDPCIDSSACFSNRCATFFRADGVSCGSVGDTGDRRSCLGGVCVNPIAYCDHVTSSGGGWVFQQDGTGGFYVDATCSCATGSLLRFAPIGLPFPPSEVACTSCVATGLRRVCF